MTIREIIEASAREAATDIWSRFKTCWPELVGDYREDSNPPAIERIIERAAIAILTDPNVGFKEALEYCNKQKKYDGGPCADCNLVHETDKKLRREETACTCPCHTAEAKLAELKELEAKK